MLFNSYSFLMAFLPISLVIYFFSNRYSWNVGKLILLAMSAIFIGIEGSQHIVVAIFSTIVNFILCKLIDRENELNRRKFFLVLGVVFNIILLSVFKYSSIVDVFGAFPLGLSFYTFQQIGFLTDVFRKETNSVGIKDYALFTLFFPKMMQGPIPFAKEIFPTIISENNKLFSLENFSKGIYLFSIGLAKKVLLADIFGIIADFGYQNASGLNSYEAILTVLAFSFQLYFDFSGYSDMAVGIGYMFNIQLPINFNSPYKAKNISEFWNCWHITLTRFLTKYIYIPLGGNRKGSCRTYLNILIVYLVSGIWHGTGSTFLIWGLMHGAATVFYRVFSKRYNQLPDIMQWGLTFIFVNIAWIFFRADSAETAIIMIQNIFTGGWHISLDAALVESLLQPTIISIFSRILSIDTTVILLFLIALIIVTKMKNSMDMCAEFKPNIKSLFVAYILLIMSIVSFSGVSGFLYTNF